jgi:putative zinc finger protein
MLSCSDLLAELSNLLDNEVPPDLRRNLVDHIAECKICQVLYDSASKTVRIVTEAGTFDLPEAVAGRVRSRVMDAIRSGRRSGSSD